MASPTTSDDTFTTCGDESLSCVSDDEHRIAESINSIPEAGCQFIIRSIPSGLVLTLREGNVGLAALSSVGSNIWTCVENEGWLGFRNAASGTFLGYDDRGVLVASATNHSHNEHVQIRQRRWGGCDILLGRHGQLQKIVTKMRSLFDDRSLPATQLGLSCKGHLRWHLIEVSPLSAAIFRQGVYTFREIVTE